MRKKISRIFSSPTMRLIFLIITTLASCLALPTQHSNLKIFGGKTAEPGQFPFIVAVNVTDDATEICAGSIIHENWILTTATCSILNNWKAEDLVVVSGTNQLDDTGGVLYNVSKIVLHPNFSAENFPDSNIALFQIDGSFTFSDLVQTVTLGDVSGNDSVTVAGWGRTKTGFNPALHYLELTAWSNEDCAEALTPIGTNIIGSGEVCAFEGQGVGICEGDVGAPLVFNGTLVGLGSWAILRCGGGYPDVFTRVSAYKDWIDSVIING